MSEDTKQRNLDSAMQMNRKEGLTETRLPGENIGNDLKKTAQAIHDKKYKHNINLCEESLSTELGDRKLNTHREEKIRQLLWETSPELRELRKKVLIADVTKDQAMQIAERQALLELKRLEEESFAEEARRERMAMEEEQKKKDKEEFQSKLNYHRDLDELRKFKQKKESTSGEELEKERTAIDDIKRKIEEEDRKLTQKRIEKQEELHRQAEELRKIRDEMRLQEILKDKAQDLRADEYRKAQELRAKEQEEKKKLSIEHSLQIQEELLFYLEKLCSEKLRQEHLRTELAIEEKEAADRQKVHDKEKKKMKIREDLQRLYEMQMYVKKQRDDVQKKEEELYRQKLMTQLYEEDRLELMSQQKRRLKKLEHMRVAQAMIEENLRRKASDQARDMADLKYNEQIESERIKKVNEEKIRFLKDHACELLGYLPKGIFKDNETIELLGDEFKNFYSRQSCSK